MKGKERSLEMSTKETFTCQHCGAEADITLEGFEKVEDVIKRKKKVICKTCGQEIGTEMHSKEAFACHYCGAEVTGRSRLFAMAAVLPASLSASAPS